MRHCPHSPTAATAINKYLFRQVCCCGPMLGQTDGWTAYHFIDGAVAGSANRHCTEVSDATNWSMSETSGCRSVHAYPVLWWSRVSHVGDIRRQQRAAATQAAHTRDGSQRRNHASTHTHTHSWWRGTVVERRSLAGELSLSCARPAADGWPLMWVNRPLHVSQLG